MDARSLLLRHPLRAGDAIQLASCLYLQRELAQPVPFIGFDDRRVEAARCEGLIAALGSGITIRPFEERRVVARVMLMGSSSSAGKAISRRADWAERHTSGEAW